MPYVILVTGNGVQITVGENTIGRLLDDRFVGRSLFVLVMFLDQEPIWLGLFSCLSTHAHQHRTFYRSRLHL